MALCSHLPLTAKTAAYPKTTEDMHVVKTDLLRRTDKFDVLIFKKDLLNQIVALRIEKARQNDTQCYIIQDVPETEDE